MLHSVTPISNELMNKTKAMTSIDVWPLFIFLQAKLLRSVEHILVHRIFCHSSK